MQTNRIIEVEMTRRPNTGLILLVAIVSMVAAVILYSVLPAMLFLMALVVMSIGSGAYLAFKYNSGKLLVLQLDDERVRLLDENGNVLDSCASAELKVELFRGRAARTLTMQDIYIRNRVHLTVRFTLSRRKLLVVSEPVNQIDPSVCKGDKDISFSQTFTTWSQLRPLLDRYDLKDRIAMK